MKKTDIISALLRRTATDIFLAGIFLCVFALFHHVIPYYFSQETGSPAVSVTPQITITPIETVEQIENAEEEETDGRTEWQRKFEEHFTDEVVMTENSYSSPEISVSIDTRTIEINGWQRIYYVADIYISRIENLSTFASHGSFLSVYNSYPEELDVESGAVLAVNGDWVNKYRSGFFVRNGEAYYTDEKSAADICVLYYDGTVEMYSPGDYEIETILARNPYQVWKFGPILLGQNGEAITEFNSTKSVADNNPRTVLGYYEPGHYCLVVVDGRQYASQGATLAQLSQIISELGCTSAYNLDGGGSTVMTFEDSVYNVPSETRAIGDIVLIRDFWEDSDENQGETNAYN